jgi:hypothetical protein
MAILSAIGKSIGGFIFTISLITAIAAIGIIWLTDYHNIKPIAQDITLTQFAAQINQSQLEDLHRYLLYECNRTGKQNISLQISKDIPNLTINCSAIPSTSDLPVLIFEITFDQIYYKSYDCWFPDCIKGAQSIQDIALLMITAKANSFFIELQTYAYIGIVIGALLIAISVRKPTRIAKSIGISMIVTAIPFLLIPFTQNLLPFPEASYITTTVVSRIMAVITPYVLAVFVIGIVLLISGILIKRQT